MGLCVLEGRTVQVRDRPKAGVTRPPIWAGLLAGRSHYLFSLPYPHLIAILRFPLLSKFRLRIQTMHLNGTGHENAHQVTDRRAADTETPDPGAAFYICSPHRSHCAPQAHQNTLLRHFFTCSASMLLHAQTRSRILGNAGLPLLISFPLTEECPASFHVCLLHTSTRWDGVDGAFFHALSSSEQSPMQ